MRTRAMTSAMLMVLAAVAGILGGPSFAMAPAAAAGASPQWTVTSVSLPTNFTPGDRTGDQEYVVTVTNSGDAPSDGTPVTITDELPQGLTLDPAGASGEDGLAIAHNKSPQANFVCVFGTCTYSGAIATDDTLIVRFPVDVSAGAPSTVTNVVRVAGGGAPDAVVQTPTSVSGEPARFGISPGGVGTALSSVQAGAHPDLTTKVALNTVNLRGSLAGDFKDVSYELPPGFALDLADTPICSLQEFGDNKCPIATQVGVSTVTLITHAAGSGPLLNPVYNLPPNPGQVAKIGFFGHQGSISLLPGYGSRTTFENTPQNLGELDNVSLTLWGVPADPIHDPMRLNPSANGGLGAFGTSSDAAPSPFFVNPTSCDSAPLQARFEITAWDPSSPPAEADMPFGPMVGCDRLTIAPSFTAKVSSKAYAPSGLDTTLVSQQTYGSPHALVASNLRSVIVTLPEGMTLNPSAGAGLIGCSEAAYQEAASAPAAAGCPSESKLGTVKIVTPALSEEVTGSVFLAQPYANPFKTLLALYVIASIPDRGVVVRAAGEVTADPLTGQLVSTFNTTDAGNPHEGLPPEPLTTFTLKFDQGATSPLVTPPGCGVYVASAELSSWAAPLEALPVLDAPFAISEGLDGGACPSGGVPPFHPQVIAGTNDNAGGSYSPFYLRIVREDGEQEITRFSTVMPPGLTGNLSGIPFCSDQAIEHARRVTGQQELAEPSCPAASRIGHTLVEAGVGSVLAETPGNLYLAGPYHGAPLSLVSVTSATVGPFDLGTVVIRFALRINPITAQVEVDATGSDPIPHIIQGIVTHVRDIRAYLDRPNFMINPTSCEHMQIANTITGAGADPSNPGDQQSVNVTSPFQAANCQSLKFKPKFAASTSEKTSRADGASLTVKLAVSGPLGSQANIHQVKVELPVQLPSRLSTLQKACTSAQFHTDPAGCPAASVVGHARAITPILPVPLEGPAYFVSNGGEAFPNLILVLQGYGVTIDLVGDTFISKAGVTSSTFKTIPDQPVTSFELTLPEGPYSALTALGNLCAAKKLTMPTELVAQNGAEIKQSTKIEVQGCRRAKKAHHQRKKHDRKKEARRRKK